LSKRCLDILSTIILSASKNLLWVVFSFTFIIKTWTMNWCKLGRPHPLFGKLYQFIAHVLMINVTQMKSCWNGNWLKCSWQSIDEMTGSWNDSVMIWLGDEMTGSWNDWVMKWQGHEMTNSVSSKES